MNLILFGFKGCGKTWLGKKLAEKASRPFIDTDDQLSLLYQRKTGKMVSPRDIYLREGAAAFRVLEKEALFSLDPKTQAIIALGGGTVLDPDNVRYLEAIGQLVYLKTSPETLKKRLMLRELPAFLLEEGFDAAFAARKTIYESIQAKQIDLDALDINSAITALFSLLFR